MNRGSMRKWTQKLRHFILFCRDSFLGKGRQICTLHLGLQRTGVRRFWPFWGVFWHSLISTCHICVVVGWEAEICRINGVNQLVGDSPVLRLHTLFASLEKSFVVHCRAVSLLQTACCHLLNSFLLGHSIYVQLAKSAMLLIWVHELFGGWQAGLWVQNWEVEAEILFLDFDFFVSFFKTPAIFLFTKVGTLQRKRCVFTLLNARQTLHQYVVVLLDLEFTHQFRRRESALTKATSFVSCEGSFGENLLVDDHWMFWFK